MLVSGLGGACSSRRGGLSSSRRNSSSSSFVCRHAAVRGLVSTCAAAEDKNNSPISSSNPPAWPQLQPTDRADPAAAQQQNATPAAQQRQGQHRARGSYTTTNSNNSSSVNPYDNTRWWVRSSDWKKGAPPMEQRPLDYLVVGPSTPPHRHSRYLTAKLWTGGKGRIMLLCHGSKGAAKVLSALNLATRQLQRKYSSTLLCQVGPADSDALQLKLIARLWPYAGTWLVPGGSSAAASSSSGSSDALPGQHPVTAAAPAPAAGSADSSSGSGDGGGADTAAAGAATAAAPRQKPRGSAWLLRGLQGALPDPQQLPPSIRRLPPFALPVLVSRKCTFRACRSTDPKALAQQIATAIMQKGRCRVHTAGGLAALAALQGVRLADVLLARAWQQGLVMHVQCVTEKQPVALLGQSQQQQQQQAPTAAEASQCAAGAAADGGAAASGLDVAAVDEDEAAFVDGETEGEQEEEGAGGYMPQEWDNSADAAAAAAGFTPPGILLDPVKQRQQVKYYVLTLIAAQRDLDATPNTSVFVSSRHRQGGAPQQQQQPQPQQGRGGA